MPKSRPTLRSIAAWLSVAGAAAGWACASAAPDPGAPSVPAALPAAPSDTASAAAPRALRTLSILDADLLEHAGIRRPERLAYAPDGTLYVLDGESRRVVALDPAGRPLRSIGGYGSDDASLQLPVDLGVDRRGSLLVLDRGRAALVAFDHEGRFLTAREFEDAAAEEARAPGARLLTDPFGSLWLLAPVSRDLLPLDSHLAPARVARFLAPEESVRTVRLAAFLPSGEAWVYDAGAGALRRFGAGGGLLLSVPVADPTAGESASDLVVDRTGDLYMAEAAEQRIRAFDASGRATVERVLGGAAVPWRPTSLALGPQNRLAVADADRDEIQVLSIERGSGP
jgi:streptogramin lyase